MANATATQLQQLYIAYFGRAADPAGIDYWVAQGTTTEDFAASMYAQPEFQDVNASLTTTLQINAIYQNLFGRDGDAKGLTYWTNKVTSGEMELASIANDLIWSVDNDPQSQADVDALANKTAAAELFTEDIRDSDEATLAYQPKTQSPWVTGTNFETAKTFFKTVTASNSVTAAEVQANVDEIAGNNNNAAASTYTLSTYVDTPSDTYTTFEASLNENGVQTLGSLDKLKGTTGDSDVLNATIVDNVAPSQLLVLKQLMSLLMTTLQKVILEQLKSA